MNTRSEPGAVPAGIEIPLSVPELRGNEWKYVKECLDTNFVSSVGPFVDRFEQMMTGVVGSRHAIATVNGTAAGSGDSGVMASTRSTLPPRIARSTWMPETGIGFSSTVPVPDVFGSAGSSRL